MTQIRLPIRFTKDDDTGHIQGSLLLSPRNSGLLLVDCDGDCGEECNQVIQKKIAPALKSACAAGIQPVFIYGDSLYPDGVNSLAAEYHRKKRGCPPNQETWRPH